MIMMMVHDNDDENDVDLYSTSLDTMLGNISSVLKEIEPSRKKDKKKKKPTTGPQRNGETVSVWGH